MLTLTKRILRAWRNYSYEQAFVIGPQGSGKTTYAMLVAHEVYSSIGKEWLKERGFSDPWEAVLHFLSFDPRELMEDLNAALEGSYRIPVIIFDDAGVHLSKYLMHGSSGYKLAMWLNALFNLIRTICAATIFTSPDMDVLKELRKKSWLIVEIMKSSKGKRYREAVIYTKRVSASGKVYVSRKAIDLYSLDLVPEDVRRRYEEKRRKAMKPVLDELRSMLQAPAPVQTSD